MPVLTTGLCHSPVSQSWALSPHPQVQTQVVPVPTLVAAL